MILLWVDDEAPKMRFGLQMRIEGKSALATMMTDCWLAGWNESKRKSSGEDAQLLGFFPLKSWFLFTHP